MWRPPWDTECPSTVGSRGVWGGATGDLRGRTKAWRQEGTCLRTLHAEAVTATSWCPSPRFSVKTTPPPSWTRGSSRSATRQHQGQSAETSPCLSLRQGVSPSRRPCTALHRAPRAARQPHSASLWGEGGGGSHMSTLASARQLRSDSPEWNCALEMCVLGES